jgi:hypothetical protein
VRSAGGGAPHCARVLQRANLQQRLEPRAGLGGRGGVRAHLRPLVAPLQDNEVQPARVAAQLITSARRTLGRTHAPRPPRPNQLLRTRY